MLDTLIEEIPGGYARGEERGHGSISSRGLRIAMVAARCFPYMGGIESHIHEVAPRLAARGHSVTLLTTDVSRQLAAKERRDGVQIERVGAWPRKKDYYFAPGIFSQIMSGNFDFVHIQGYHTLVPPIAMLAAIRKRVPFAITFHSGGHSSPIRNALRQIQWKILSPLVRKAAVHIGVSEFEADFFSRKMGVPRSQFLVVPNGMQSVGHVPSAADSQAGPLIISIGRLEKYKGHHRAIEAMPKLQWRYPNAQLIILGSGPYEPELKKLISKLRLGNCVSITSIPPQNRRDLISLLAKADLVTLLSEYEAHPIAVMEALATGRKVLTSDTSGFRELAAKNLIRTVPLKSSSFEIAVAAAEALESPSPRAGEFSLSDWDGCASTLDEIYRSVVPSKVG